MKIAHFAIFAPHGSGQYGTVYDLMLAERAVGIDAQFVDYGYGKKAECREGLKDGEICTVPVEWAFEADVVFRHSVVPNQLLDEKPVIFALHGRPENSFRLELYDEGPIISTLLDASKGKKYKAFLTFWPEFLHYWSRILRGSKVFYIPPPVDLDTYNPHGVKHLFKHDGNPNIVIADRWREDRTPFNLIFAAQYFKEHFYPDAKLQIYGIPTKKTAINFLAPLQKGGLMGEVSGLIKHIADIYRSADFVITPNIIATRIVRESMATGVPIVAPVGCQYTPFTAEPRDIKSFAEAMKLCWEYPTDSVALRKRAKELFGPEAVGNAMKTFLERVLNAPSSSL